MEREPGFEPATLALKICKDSFKNIPPAHDWDITLRFSSITVAIQILSRPGSLAFNPSIASALQTSSWINVSNTDASQA